MTGWIDGQLRALLRIPVSASRDGNRTEIDAWIDTAFNGSLSIPREQISQLNLLQEASVDAILADGKMVELETFACFIDWFGQCYKTQITASEGQVALLGTMLLAGHRVTLDYQANTVDLS